MRRLAGASSPTLGGLALFVIAAGGAATAFLTLNRSSRSVLTFGTAALIAGVATTLLAVANSSVLIFFAGTLIAGAGYGGGLLTTAREYGMAVMLLSGLALLGTMARRPRREVLRIDLGGAAD